MSRVAADDSFAATRLIRANNANHGLSAVAAICRRFAAGPTTFAAIIRVATTPIAKRQCGNDSRNSDKEKHDADQDGCVEGLSSQWKGGE